MAAIALAMAWGGYTLTLWGWCLLKGYDVSLKELMSPTWPPPKTSAAANAPGTNIAPIPNAPTSPGTATVPGSASGIAI